MDYHVSVVGLEPGKINDHEIQRQDMSNRKILIVEDDAAIREGLRYALELEGYEVSTAIHGKDGLEQLAKGPSPCLILLDLMMPVMNGWQFIDALGKDIVLANIPVVLVTAFSDQAKGLNTKGIIKKPIDLVVLLQMVKKCCLSN
ncbi:MAG: response regulator [Bdellovibrio sp.]|nr:response regulator [Bdellovibrio sp.]